MKEAAPEKMKATHGAPLWWILFIPFFLASCGKGETGPMVELNRYDHRGFGTIRVCYLKQPLEIQSWPCKRGKIRYYDDGRLLSFKLERDHLLQGDSIPRGSGFTLFRSGNPKFLRLSKPARIQGHQVAGGSFFSSRLTTYYGDGSLKSFHPAGNISVEGITCSEQRDIELYPDGQIMVCRLNEDYSLHGDIFPAGSMLLFDEHRKVYTYSSEMHAAIHSQFDMEKYLNEKLLHVYDLRLKGRTKQAFIAIRNLEKEDGFNPLVRYEKTRIQRTRFLGGAPGESYESILGTSMIPVFTDSHNVTFCYFDGDCARWAGHGKMEEGDSLTARRYYLRAIGRFETCLILKPDCQVARFSLVQLYARLPLFLGGDMEKAGKHRAILEQAGPVEGARAASMYLADPARKLAIWLDLLAKYPDDPVVNHETGRACLLCGDPWKAEEYYRKVMEDDPARSLLLLDLGRAYLEETALNGGVAGEQITRAEACFREVLESEPIQPVQAWCFSQLARCMEIRGNSDEAEALRSKAKQADELYVKGNRPAPAILYNTPGELPPETYNYFDPF